MRTPFKKIKIFWFFLIFFIILSLNFFQNQVRNFFYFFSQPLSHFFWQVSNKAVNFLEFLLEMNNLEKENEELKSRLKEVVSENLRLKELKKENESLRKALEIGLEKDFQILLAKVIGREISQDSLIINKGLKNGLSKDLAVVTEEKILLGKIEEVGDNFSRVLLITNEKISFEGKVADKEISGLVKGKGRGEMSFELIPREAEVSQEDQIVTTSLARIFPPGILIGEIKSFQKNDLEPFQKIEIEAAFSLKKLENVFVILEF